MNIKTFILDSCATKPFTGNPTPVCILNSEYPDNILQSIATEFNLPVCVFVLKEKIRYFTSTTEIPACGHGTIAAAKLLYLLNGITEIEFITIEKLKLPVKIESGLPCIEYPNYNLKEYPVTNELLSSLGITEYVSAGLIEELETLVIEVDDPSVVRKLRPDYEAMMKSDNKIVEVVVTSISDDIKYDYLLRSFCPWIGIDEDPVTGSVQAALGGFWKEKLGKNPLSVFQASERTGQLSVFVTEKNTVTIKSDALIVLRGELNL